MTAIMINYNQQQRRVFYPDRPRSNYYAPDGDIPNSKCTISSHDVRICDGRWPCNSFYKWSPRDDIEPITSFKSMLKTNPGRKLLKKTFWTNIPTHSTMFYFECLERLCYPLENPMIEEFEEKEDIYFID